MKKMILGLIIFLLTIPVYADVAIDSNAFPDPTFRNMVLSYDKNGDHILSYDEMGHVYGISCNEKGITSLKGIEYFYNLEELSCYSNQVTGELDVSKNTRLKKLVCSSNKITSLKLGVNDWLRYLSCYDNPLTSLNVSSNRELKNLVLYQYRHTESPDYVYYYYSDEWLRIPRICELVVGSKVVAAEEKAATPSTTPSSTTPSSTTPSTTTNSGATNNTSTNTVTNDLSSATIKTSKNIVQKGKKTTVKFTANSGGKITVKGKSKNAKNKKYVKISGSKVIFQKKAPKGTYKFTVTSAAKGNYKKTTNTISVKVK